MSDTFKFLMSTLLFVILIKKQFYPFRYIQQLPVIFEREEHANARDLSISAHSSEWVVSFLLIPFSFFQSRTFFGHFLLFSLPHAILLIDPKPCKNKVLWAFPAIPAVK